MKDLQKMKNDFEKELKLAEIENHMEQRFGCEFMVLGRFNKEGARIIAKTEDTHVAAELLKAFHADEEQPLDASGRNPNGTISGLYHVRAERGFRDPYTKLRVSWLCNGNEYEFSLKIDGNELLEIIDTIKEVNK